MAVPPERVRLVPYEPPHQQGFVRLVAEVLAEFGFGVDPVLEADLANPGARYNVTWVAVDADAVVGSVAIRRLGDGEAELKRMYPCPPTGAWASVDAYSKLLSLGPRTRVSAQLSSTRPRR